MTHSARAGSILGAALFGLSLPVSASAITIDGINLEQGATFITTTLWEGRVDGTNPYQDPISGLNQELGGIGVVEAIRDSGGTTIWQDGDNGRELTFQFGGYTTERLEDDGGNLAGGGSFDPTDTPIEIWFRDGFANFYSDSTPNRTVNSGTIATDIASFTDGSEWLNMLGASVLNCAVGDGCASGAGTGISLQSFVNSGQLSFINSATGSGLLNVDTTGSGSANTAFDSDAVSLDANGNPVDMTLDSSFNSVASNDFFASGSSTLKATVVPEPGGLALLGIGLLAIGAFGFRRGRKPSAAAV
ncbi:MAG TPA: PEP-CTERM sorting domain-containing protein [Gammaproteobacteria bacterium]|nr:PEP-CTERM sorting domain-containing protein [Gammaproteobacteria bacterium]